MNNLYRKVNRINNPANSLDSYLKAKAEKENKEKKNTNQNFLKLKTKQILKVYVEPETNKKYVDIEVARILGILDRKNMIDNSRLYPITDQMISIIKNKGDEIEVIMLPPKQKPRIKLYYKENNTMWLEFSAAYALEYIDVSKFYDEKGLYGPLNDREIFKIKRDYDCEFIKYPRSIDEYNPENSNRNKFYDNNQIITVYIDSETNTKYVEAQVARKLGITNVRAIIIDTPRLYPIDDINVAKIINIGKDVEYKILNSYDQNNTQQLMIEENRKTK